MARKQSTCGFIRIPCVYRGNQWRVVTVISDTEVEFSDGKRQRIELAQLKHRLRFYHK